MIAVSWAADRGVDGCATLSLHGFTRKRRLYSVTLTLEHTWDGRAVDMIAAGKKKAAELAKQF
jgi:hypothetical protein